MRRLIIAAALLVLCAPAALSAYETRTVRATGGWWVWSANVQGIEGAGTTANVTRFKTHHNGLPVKASVIEIMHSVVGADTVCVKFWNGASLDSVLYITSTQSTLTIPVCADSAAFRAFKTSAPGEWFFRSFYPAR